MGAAIQKEVFSAAYQEIVRACAPAPVAREETEPIPEAFIQRVWHEQRFNRRLLRTVEGQRLEVVSPGWWNKQEGPDFRGAQLLFNGQLLSGDVEVHLEGANWRAHGHHTDGRYEGVILHVVLSHRPSSVAAVTCQGRKVATLHLAPFLAEEVLCRIGDSAEDNRPDEMPASYGRCATLWPSRGTAALERFLELAGGWRMLAKARRFQERAQQTGPEQALYEDFLAACGYSQFKQHFREVARALPYERARQLALQDPQLLEAALAQLAGLLPAEAAPEAPAPLHKLIGLRDKILFELRALPLEWRFNGVRPNNRPERRLAGAVRVISRSSRDGLLPTLEQVWRLDCSPHKRRAAFEEMFPGAIGFWATHAHWLAKPMLRPAAPIGSGRVRGIIGNVFIPAGLALARVARDRAREEQIFTFFARLPKEPENRVLRVMLPHLIGGQVLKMNFQRQQGLMQIYEDWCEVNPSCRNCRLYEYFDSETRAEAGKDLSN